MTATQNAGQLAALLPGYRIERRLGRGAMSVVHLARHERLDRLVAVKELPRALAADPETRRRFEREAQVLASMNHPHIVPVYDYVERDEQCLLVMEHLAGGTAWDRFSSAGFVGPEAVALMLATTSAMHHAHEHGVLHRDIKPENLMFDSAGTLKVTDFGIAHVINGASTKVTSAGLVFGTPVYMAPEQAAGRELDVTADVYSGGTVLYEMLTGRLPFDGADTVMAALEQRIREQPIPVTTVSPRIPLPIAEVTMRAIARDPGQRFESAEEFGVELGRAASRAWGPRWLDEVDLDVRGNSRITDAARSLQLFPGAELSSGPIDTARVRPDDDGRHRPGPDRRHPDQLIDIAEVTSPFRRPLLWYALAALLAVIGVALAVVGFGQDVAEPPDALDGVRVAGQPMGVAPIFVDLGDPIEVTGLGAFEPGFASISFSSMGATLTTTDPVDIVGGTVQLDASRIERVTSGPLVGTLEVTSGTTGVEGSFRANATQPGIATIEGAASLAGLLLGLMGIETALSMLRRQRLRPGLIIGTAAGGAVTGACLAVVTKVFMEIPQSGASVVMVSIATAAAAVVLGVATSVRRRRHLERLGLRVSAASRS